MLDERWSFPAPYSAPAGATPPSLTAGWGADTDERWAATLALPFLAGAAPAPSTYGAAVDRPVAAVLPRSLAVALFGSPQAAVGRLISSSLHAPVPVVGVVRDARMHVPFFMPRSEAVAFLFG